MTYASTYSLQQASQQLTDCCDLSAIAKQLSKQITDLDKVLYDEVLQHVPAFTQSSNPDLVPELARHIHHYIAEIMHLLKGGSPGDFEFVVEHAKLRAEEYFPLEASLHAYRSMQKVFTHLIQEAVLKKFSAKKAAPEIITAVTGFMLEYADTVSTIATSAYIKRAQFLADVAGDQRSELLSILLEGHDESDGRLAKTLRDAGYLDRRQSFCVILAQSVDPVEMFNAARARRLADSIAKALSYMQGQRLIDIYRNKVTIVFSHLRRISGWTAPQTELAQKVAAELLKVGTAARIGVSNDVPSTSQIPSAYKEASIAFEIANVSNRVIQFSNIPVRQLLLHLAGEDFQHILPSWTKAFFAADKKSSGALSSTIRAYADANMNILKAAQYLSIHPNTIYARFEKISDTTGLDARSYESLTELLIVTESQPVSQGDM